jgi:hypothetical protein
MLSCPQFLAMPNIFVTIFVIVNRFCANIDVLAARVLLEKQLLYEPANKNTYFYCTVLADFLIKNIRVLYVGMLADFFLI